jgi:hypothetical protein
VGRSRSARLFWRSRLAPRGLLAVAGVPAVIFGPGGPGAHADVPPVELADVARCVDVFVATVDASCS